MNKTMKIWFITASFLVVLGLIMFIVAMALNRWDFAKLSTVKYETNTYALSDEFIDVSIKTDTTDIIFVPSDDGICKVVCYEIENAKHKATVKDGTLTINVVNERKWYEYIGITLGSPKITVYLPKAEYSTISIKSDTGDIKLSSLSCKSLKAESDTGDILLSKVIAADSFTINSDTGDVSFEKSDAAVIFVETDTGDVTGTLLSDKVFIVETDTGSIDVPKTVTGGRCEITTDTGDIKIDIQ